MQRAAAASPREPSEQHVRAALRAGLHYVHDRQPGLRRRRQGKGFAYTTDLGAPVRDAATLARMRALAIPPAWTEVWICRDPHGHIQATGRDARSRKQYRYHARFRHVRDETKYEKIFDFAAAVPKIRAHCERDLACPKLSREKVLAAVVCLLEQTLIRVGNEEYTRLNQSFGLTTLRDGHAHFRGASVEFRFRGKSGKEHAVSVNDARLAKIVKRCRELPGDELFQYLCDDGTRHAIDSADVNAYLRAITGEDFTAKDFRTFAGTMLAALALAERGPAPSQRAARKQIVAALEHASERLGNTPAVCRKCYVHPGILEAYMRGRVVPRVTECTPPARANKLRTQLRAEEKAVLAFLRRQLAELAREQAPGGLERVLRRSVRMARVRNLHTPANRAAAHERRSTRAER